MSDSNELPPALEQGVIPIPLVQPPPGTARGNRPARRRRPLPDAQAIAEIALPEHAPPYDDARVARRRSNRPQRLALVEPGHADTRSLADIGEADGEPISGAGAWPSRFAQVLAETLAGARSAEQLAPWTTQQARRRISQLGPMLAAGPQPRIRRLIVTSPVPTVLEITAIIAVGSDVHAVAVRLEALDAPGPPGAPTALTAAPTSIRAARLRATARWLCTAVEVA